MKVAAVQIEVIPGDREHNLKTIAEWTRKAAGEKVDLVCFPELSTCGYFNATLASPRMSLKQIGDTVWNLSEAIPGGATCKFLEQLAYNYDLVVCAGIAERENDVIYNSYVIISPQGYVGKYRKTHSPTVEYPYFRVGYELPVFELQKCKLGISICYDNRFPEMPRILALKGAEIILMPHAWPYEDPFRKIGLYRTVEERREEVGTYLPSRAYDNRVFAIFVDHVGKVSENMSFPGVSMVLDPMGHIITQTEGNKEEMLLADLNSEILYSTRSGTYFTLRLRRPEIYTELSRLY